MSDWRASPRRSLVVPCEVSTDDGTHAGTDSGEEAPSNSNGHIPNGHMPNGDMPNGTPPTLDNHDHEHDNQDTENDKYVDVDGDDDDNEYMNAGEGRNNTGNGCVEMAEEAKNVVHLSAVGC
jgi:hypothetical protein